ncbi:glycosyltransferase family 2 protein [Actinomyces lilanjuaniae]|uniref:Glycosyltransferase family 2 protein n=1 Tax=Actinomyces lilanjuaniae TaxID=2321394 RepID=A0ABN5PT52_9ACTO|nr:glycosyltransferase family 2 protein [Actinomyces lilanjuaniae]AYD89961.1 glycosyltransferase family 2 protein [Actinomyces lilanjuaniae]
MAPLPPSAPLLTLVVPAYNAQDYVTRCLNTLVGHAEVEVVVVDDGSTDSTPALLDDYARREPRLVVVHQQNKGHGGAVNTGLARARGTWVKVVDSDDALDRASLLRLLSHLRRWRQAGQKPDLVVTNFTYVREGSRLRRHSVRYRGILPQGRVGTWSDVGRFRPDQYLMMHSLTYRTQVLRDSGTRLPEHCFYVDTLYSFQPLASVRSLTYLDLDLYLYTVGRQGQSVADEVIIRRLDQHDRVNALMLESMPRAHEVPPELMRYLVHIYTMSCVVITTMALRSGTPENLAIREGLWQRLDARRPDISVRVRRSLMGRLMNLPGRAGSRVPVAGYQVARRILALN